MSNLRLQQIQSAITAIEPTMPVSTPITFDALTQAFVAAFNREEDDVIRWDAWSKINLYFQRLTPDQFVQLLDKLGVQFFIR